MSKSTRVRAVQNRLALFFEAFDRHDVFSLAAALSFYTALSIGPFMILMLTAIAGLGPDWGDALIFEIDRYIGNNAAEAVRLISENVKNRPDLTTFAGWVSVAVLAFSASAVFGSLQTSLNKIFGWAPPAEQKRSWWAAILWSRLVNFGMVLSFLFISIVSLVFSTFLHSALMVTNEALFRGLDFVISLLAYTGAFALLFRFVPDQKVQWRHVGRGSVITAFLFVVGKSLIGSYLGGAAIGSVYGAAGVLVVFLAWVYYTAIIIYSGAEMCGADRARV